MLKSFGTEEIIIAAVPDFHALNQPEQEKKWAFRLLARETARLLGNSHSKNGLFYS